MIVRAGKDILNPAPFPSRTVEKDAGHAGLLRGSDVGGAVPDVPDVRPGPRLHVFHGLVDRIGGGLEPRRVAAGHHAVEQAEPGARLEVFELVLQKLSVSVGQDANADAEPAYPGQHLTDAGLERRHIPVVVAVTTAEGVVRNLLGFLVAAEQYFQQIGSGHLFLRHDLGMQPAVLAHVVHQLAVGDGFTALGRHQPMQQSQPVQHAEHVVGGLVHGVHGVHQGRMPIEQDNARRLGHGAGQRVRVRRGID